jgi:sugar phosphate isomerase/epimerase
MINCVMGKGAVATDLIASYWTIAGNTLPLLEDTPSPVAFAVRAEAAARAGFIGMGIHHTDLLHITAQFGYAEVRAILAHNGMEVVELEAMIDWFADGDRRRRSDAIRNTLLQAAGELGAHQIKAVADTQTDWPFGAMVDEFGELADRAFAAGARLSLEIMHGSNVSDLPTAVELLDSVSRRNAGLMLDIWHIARGGIRYSDIAALPRSQIFGVELNDGLRRCEGSPIEDTIFRRRFCGEGEFDIAGFVAAINATGYKGPWGVEVLSDRVRNMQSSVAASLAFSSTTAALGAAESATQV